MGSGNVQAAVCPEPGHRSELSPLVEYWLESRENKAGQVAAGYGNRREGKGTRGHEEEHISLSFSYSEIKE